MTTQHVELPQALHVALLNCQAAHDIRSAAHRRYLDSLLKSSTQAIQSRLNQEHHQATQQADAAFRALGRALDAEGGHGLWRIVYLKGGRTRSRIQVRPTRESHARREAQARHDLRRELEAQGAQVQYLVALPLALAPDADRWERTAGMVRLGHRVFQPRNSLGGKWAVIAYGQAPAPAPHNPFTCLDVACAACHGLDPDPTPEALLGRCVECGWEMFAFSRTCDWCGGQVDLTDTACGKPYSPAFDFRCDLDHGHEGQHQDQHTDAPATVAWSDPIRGQSIPVAQVLPTEAAYARHLAAHGKCSNCHALSGNRHQDDCPRGGIVGNFTDPWNQERQDAPRAARKPQDARSAHDLTGWAPGEITEAYGR